jgi:hypothetical protein
MISQQTNIIMNKCVENLATENILSRLRYRLSVRAGDQASTKSRWVVTSCPGWRQWKVGRPSAHQRSCRRLLISFCSSCSSCFVVFRRVFSARSLRSSPHRKQLPRVFLGFGSRIRQKAPGGSHQYSLESTHPGLSVVQIREKTINQ